MGETEERTETHRVRCLSKMKMFLMALTCAYVSKTLSGAYMNSMLTQIERRFNIPTSLVGLINGSFEIGNLMLIIFVSYFGTKLHRPIVIGVGCLLMGLGCFLISLPHFLMSRYEYESTISASRNLSSNSFLCVKNETSILRPTEDPSECVREVKSLMWLYVLVGNIIRGIGETPIMPLGISYIEDFAKPENSPLYIGILEVGAVLGPLMGLLIASFCAKIYVDTGFVNTDDLTISPSDTRWVGAWWFGFLICAGVNILTGIPFFFLSKTIPKEGLEHNADIIIYGKEDKQREVKKEKHGITEDFLPFIKSLACNPIYMLFTIVSVLQINAFIIMFSFLPKYLEQHYGKSTSDAVFLIGVYNLPPVCFGFIIGGLIMKKFKITVIQAAHIGCWLTLFTYLFYFLCFLLGCDSVSVAGITASYEGIPQDLFAGNELLAECNRDCNCQATWDPVCGDDDLSYVSACLAGCGTSVGAGVNMVFQNCSCIQAPGHSSAVLGLCDKGRDCPMMLQYFLIILVAGSFIFSLAAIPGYMVLLRCMKSEEKALGVGLHTFFIRIFAGIPAPIYFGALVDSTCLRWGTLKCGKPGACRIYDSKKFRYIYLGLPAALRGVSYIPSFCILMLMRKRCLPEESDSSETELAMTKMTEKENKYNDACQNSKVLNDEEMKA